MRAVKGFFIFLIVAAILGCDNKIPILESEYAILVLEVKDVSNLGALLRGKFLTNGISEIQEFGFMFSDTKNANSHKIILDTIKDEFEYLLNHSITREKEYFVKAYAISQDYTSYSNTVSFISQGFPQTDPIIHSYAPAQVTDDMEVILVGKNFIYQNENTKILVIDTICEILQISPDTIIFKVPSLKEGEKTFTLRVNNIATSFGPIHVNKPVIDDFFPREGYDGELITINGNFFGKDPTVYFGDELGNITASNNTTIEVKSPLTSAYGDVNIMVRVSEKNTSSIDKYSMLIHEISDISPATGKVGDRISIYGSGFVQNGRPSVVYFYGTEARIKYNWENRLDVYVPFCGEEEGENLISIKNGLKSVENNNFNIVSSWEQLPDFPGTAMDDAVGTSLNSMGYVGLGYANTLNRSSSEWWRFDPGFNTWTRLSDFPGEPRYGSLSFALNNRIFIVFGYERSSSVYGYKELWEYYPETDTWSQKESPEIADNFNFRLASACTYKEKAYIQIGNILMVYDPDADQWEIRDFPQFNDTDFTTDPFCYNIGNRLYWFFGSDYELKMYLYEPEQDEWTYIKKFKNIEVRADATRFMLNNKGYFGGGRMWTVLSPNSSLFYEFDPASMDIVKKENFHRESARQSSFAINNKAYIGLGIDRNSEAQKDFWIFEP